MKTIDVNLYFDLRSHRARVTWGKEDRILPDIFPNRATAEAAARTVIRQALTSSAEAHTWPEIRVWSR